MQGGSWKLEVDTDRIAWLTFDTPGSSTNVLSAAVLKELASMLSEVSQAKPRGLVLRSGKRSQHPHARRLALLPAFARMFPALASLDGRVAQLGERLVRNEEVRGSSPLTSTTFTQ